LNALGLRDAGIYTGLNRNKLNALSGKRILSQQIANFQNLMHISDEDFAGLENLGFA
jgi:hypothetical protein